ncbi:hypothetical protein SeMB42_g01554 [Synchytrium endobioticum]|uniref:Uncharacterized protein n=2 Tax=Synchytrium endobioticum TaxID=286115 RepID=A0A507DMV9_9FUNG|nr:hypothetical protein SeMB42_g01554 [Synchytrium endobioticum]
MMVRGVVAAGRAFHGWASRLLDPPAMDGSASYTNHPSAGPDSLPPKTIIVSLHDDGWCGRSSAAQSDDQSAKGTHDFPDLYESRWSGSPFPSQVIGGISGTSSGSSISNARALSRD